MIAVNTIPKEEYDKGLFEAFQKVRQHLSRMADEEDMAAHKAEDANDRHNFLLHYYRSQAYGIALGRIMFTEDNVKNKIWNK